MDLNKLSTSDKVIAGSAIGLFICSFLPWFGAGPYDGNGWDVGFLWAGLPVILGLAMLAVVAIRAFSPDTKLPDLPIPWSLAMLIAGGLAAFLVVLKLLLGYEVCAGTFGCADLDRKFGLVLAALAAIGLVVGAFMQYQQGDSATAGGTDTPNTPF